MTDITNDIKQLRKTVPQAVITVETDNDGLKFTCDMRHTKITSEEKDKLFDPIKQIFGTRFKEMYSHSTRLFDVYVRHNRPQDN